MSRAAQSGRDDAKAQRRAALPGASAWVSANAGSGKTRVLTDRIIRLMLAGADPGELLSITYTKAAAAEMSNRLFGRLAEWSAMPDDELRGRLIELAGEDIGAGVDLPKARRLFARALETPGGLKIQTIHAFAESVLGRFPLEAGVSPEFDVLDDVAAREVLAELQNRLLTGEGLDPAATDSLDRLIAARADDSFAKLLGAAISQRRLIATALKRYDGIENLIAAVRKALTLQPEDTLDAIRDKTCRSADFDTEGLGAAVAALNQERGLTALRNAGVIADWLAAEEAARPALLDDYYRVFLTAKGAPHNRTIPAGVARSAPVAEAALAAEQERLLRLAELGKSVRAAEETADLLRIAAPLIDRYGKAKQGRALLDYDDLIDLTLRLLESQAAWVHYKLDQGIRHILIDEAQDTGPEQWRIAELLADEFFAGVGAHADPRTVFAVGDEKQSIYSFQGADPAGFDRMRRHFAARSADADLGFEDVRLDLSYRSAPEILQAVDAVFDGLAGQELTASGAPVTHRAHRAGAQGVVELWPMDEPEEAAPAPRWQAPLDAYERVNTRRLLAFRIARRIRAMIDGGETVRDRAADGEAQRPITPGDILILVRQRGPLIDEIARALKSHEIGLPVAGADRMQLTEQIAVMDLMALGDFLLMQDDDLTLATLLKSPFFGFDDDDLIRLAGERAPGTRLWRALRERAGEAPRWRAALVELRGLLAEADQTPPAEFYGAFLGAGGGRRRLYARLGADQMDPVEEFLNCALEDERRHPPSLQGFLFRLRRTGSEIKRDMEQAADAVRIMTVHGAKGLEAPVVFLPDTARPPKARSAVVTALDAGDAGRLPLVAGKVDAAPKALLAQAERDKAATLAEYKRLLYVAMTRAEDRLYICGHYNSARSKPSDEGWYRQVEAGLAPIAESMADGVLRLGGEPPAGAPAQPAAAPPSPPAWFATPPPPEPPTQRPLSPSRAVEADPAAVSPLIPEARGSGRRRGVLIHRLLQILPDLPAAMQAGAGRESLRRRAPDLDDAARAALLDEALAVIGDSAMAPVFGPGSRAEVALTGQVGGVAVAGQVDRLAIGDAGVWIIDYKTNRPPPASLDQVAPAYLGQMALYREIIRDLRPGAAVTTALVWTHETRMMVLPDAMLDIALASLDLSGGGA